jgi:hypothetical protein
VSQEDVIALLERAASDEVFRVRLRMVLNRPGFDGGSGVWFSHAASG